MKLAETKLFISRIFKKKYLSKWHKPCWDRWHKQLEHLQTSQINEMRLNFKNLLSLKSSHFRGDFIFIFTSILFLGVSGDASSYQSLHNSLCNNNPSRSVGYGHGFSALLQPSRDHKKIPVLAAYNNISLFWANWL